MMFCLYRVRCACLILCAGLLTPVISLSAPKEIVPSALTENKFPLIDNALTKSDPLSSPMFSDSFLAEVKARHITSTNFCWPQASWDQILFAQIFSRKIVTEKDLDALARQHAFVWGATAGVVRHGGYGAVYYPSMRDFDQSRMITNGSPDIRTLEWYQKNKPEWVVYKADRTTPANDHEYSWGAFIALDITRQDVREYILNTFLIPAIKQG